MIIGGPPDGAFYVSMAYTYFFIYRCKYLDGCLWSHEECHTEHETRIVYISTGTNTSDAHEFDFECHFNALTVASVFGIHAAT